jgi:hypothetical protein
MALVGEGVQLMVNKTNYLIYLIIFCLIGCTNIEKKHTDKQVCYRIFFKPKTIIQSLKNKPTSVCDFYFDCEGNKKKIPFRCIRLGQVNRWVILLRASIHEKFNNPLVPNDIANALLCVIDTLHIEYDIRIVSVILTLKDMPEEFKERISKEFSEKINHLSGTAQCFGKGEPEINNALKSIFTSELFTVYLRAGLKEKGYIVETGPGELSSIRRSLIGRTWKDISIEKNAGLNFEAIHYCLDIEKIKDVK